MNAGVLVFAGATAVLALLLFGMLPAVAVAQKRSATQAIGSARVTLDPHRHRLRALLVSSQLALSLVLVMGATLVVRSFLSAQSQNPGFNRENLLLLGVTASSRIPDEQITDFYARLPEQLNRLPGVLTASAVNSLPISGGDSHGGLSVEGKPFDSATAPSASYRRVLPSYFRAIGIPLIAGREFDPRDRGQEPRVVIVNQTLAEREFGSAARAIGQRIKVGPPENEPWLTIVGVVGDVRNERLEANDEFATYEPHPQRPWRSMQIVVRARTDAAALAPPVRVALRELDPDILIADVGTMRDRIAASLAPRRFNAQLLTAFGVLALVLAAIGVYGIVLFLVNERRREFGIRLALGATATDLRRLVFSRAARLLVAGATAGALASVLLTRYLRSVLYGVEPLDPMSFAVALTLLCSMVLLATLGPARRAARADLRATLTE
jgi:putative ABC transport system permease protein